MPAVPRAVRCPESPDLDDAVLRVRKLRRAMAGRAHLAARLGLVTQDRADQRVTVIQFIKRFVENLLSHVRDRTVIGIGVGVTCREAEAPRRWGRKDVAPQSGMRAMRQTR